MFKLWHGNCLELMKGIADGSVDLILADPPYGTTACKWDSVIPLEPMWAELKRVIKPNGAIVMTASQPFTTTLISSNIKDFKYSLCWDKVMKTNFLNAKKQPLRQVEDICVFYRKQCTYNPQGLTAEVVDNSRPAQFNRVKGRYVYGSERGDFDKSTHTSYPTDLIRFSNRSSESYHPTQKPVALMEYLIKTYTHEDEMVLDFTMGSGSTGVAAVNTNRKFIGIELDRDYYDIAVNRINEAKEIANGHDS